MKTKKLKAFLLLMMSFILISCGGDDEPIVLNKEAVISSLTFKTSNNSILYKDVTAEVNDVTKEINAIVTVIVEPTKLNQQISLTPEVSVSNRASIEPANNTAIEVGGLTTSSTIYKVTAEDGTTQNTYTLNTCVRYINAVATEVVAVDDLIALYSIKQANPNATGRVSDWDFSADNASTILGLLTLRGININADKRITKLDIYNSNLDKLPKEIGNLTALVTIDGADNNIETFPEEIGNLTELKNCYFSNNKLKTLPSSFANLAKLDYLYLSKNEFGSFPIAIGSLIALKELTLNDNSITEIPVEIGNLTELTGLLLNNNTIEVLPPEIGNLSKLEVLKLNNNTIKPEGLPDAMTGLTALKHINLKQNSLLVDSPTGFSLEVCQFLSDKSIVYGAGSNGIYTDLILIC